MTAQLFVPALVLTGQGVLSAVRFDDELGLETGEIDDVRRDRMLSAKAPSKLAVAQPVPKCPLCVCHVSARKLRARPVINAPPRMLPILNARAGPPP